MATIMSKIAGKGPDVSTPAGFLAVYDEHVTRLRRTKRWCSGGYSYEYTGTENGKLRIPPPAERAPEQHIGLRSLPREYLTEAGLAAAEAENGEQMAVLRRGAVEAARRAIAEGYVELREANEVMAALGIGAFTQERTHNGYVASNAYFSSPVQLTAEQRDQLRNAAQAAMKTVLDGFSEVLTVREADARTDVTSDRAAQNRPVPPAL